MRGFSNDICLASLHFSFSWYLSKKKRQLNLFWSIGASRIKLLTIFRNLKFLICHSKYNERINYIFIRPVPGCYYSAQRKEASWADLGLYILLWVPKWNILLSGNYLNNSGLKDGLLDLACLLYYNCWSLNLLSI